MRAWAMAALAVLVLSGLAAAEGSVGPCGLGDGLPVADACAGAWAGSGDARAQAHEACHTTQQALGVVMGRMVNPLAPACDMPGSFALATLAMGLDGAGRACAVATSGGAAPVCRAIGDLDGDGPIDAAARACDGLAGVAPTQACAQAANLAKSKHDAAMAAIQNTR